MPGETFYGKKRRRTKSLQVYPLFVSNTNKYKQGIDESECAIISTTLPDVSDVILTFNDLILRYITSRMRKPTAFHLGRF